MKNAPRQRIEVNVDELDRVLDEARQAPLSGKRSEIPSGSTGSWR